MWVFDLPEFHDWIEGKTKVLWLSGTTGFGKSVLAAYITEELENKFPTTPIAYFFCKDNNFLHDTHHVM